MKIAAISDTHAKHSQLEMLPADILICAGDFTNLGTISEIVSFNNWLGKIQHLYPKGIFVVPGNHDIMFEDDPNIAISLITHAKVLINEEAWVKHFILWGSPVTPTFGYGWAFNYDSGDHIGKGRPIEPIWDQISANTDILITHGPPKGILDKVSFDGRVVGCEHLLKRVEEINPTVHIFGHIHANNRIAFNGNTIFCNASICDDQHQIKYKNPVIIELV
jgi:Icc-related predicted phosphoesterase